MRWRSVVALFATVTLTILTAQTDNKNVQQSTSTASEEGLDLENDHFTPEVQKFVRQFQGAGEGVKGAGDAQAPSAEETLERFRLSPGVNIELVANEPVIRQPLNMHFDERGRLWVVQYLQYPFPAGLKVVKYDRYLRAVFDKVPAPPPKHFKGADRITILEDTDGDGKFESHKDFLVGLNIATSVAVGRGGVWVLNPPYLLFYPDRNKDDVPDSDPEVHLSGFGLEDTHGLANSLRWGPDGWLYGAQGSTSTADIKGVKFLGQAIWRYHPITREFELFAEGGGNTWSVAFDRKGRLFSGTNKGGVRGLHFVPGGYYVKNWTKHGPLTNPFTFGFFEHMAHSGYQPRFSSTLTIYEGGALDKYEGQIIAGMSLTNRVQASKIIPDKSSFKTVDTEAIIESEDRWFRPVDLKVGPDGAVYIADWSDIRLSHLSPIDNWDRDHGRIYRLKAEGSGTIGTFDLSTLANEQLIHVLSHENKWFRDQALRLFGDRRDASIVPVLKEIVETNQGQLALEALWAVNLSGGFDEGFAVRQLSHPDEYVRYWSVRLLGDAKKVSPRIQARLVQLARVEKNPEVRSQLASSCRRLPTPDALPILRELLLRSEDVNDPHIPLLLWWAIESKTTSDQSQVMKMLEDKTLWRAPLFVKHIASRLGRRLTIERGDKSFYTLDDSVYSAWQWSFLPRRVRANLEACAQLLSLASDSESLVNLIAGMEEGLQGHRIPSVPRVLRTRMAKVLTTQPASPPLISLALRLGHEDVRSTALRMMADGRIAAAERRRLIVALADNKELSAVPVFLALLRKEKLGNLHIELLKALQQFDEFGIAPTIVELYSDFSPEVRAVAQDTLSSRLAWAKLLLESVDGGRIPREHVLRRKLSAIKQYHDARCDELIGKYWGGPEGSTDPRVEQQQSLFKEGEENYFSSCASCHLASGDGMRKSLVDSKWVLGPQDALVSIVLHGKKADGEMMPPFAAVFNDQEIASILTYIRRHWGNQAPSVKTETVTRIRKATADRGKPWSEEELAALLR